MANTRAHKFMVGWDFDAEMQINRFRRATGWIGIDLGGVGQFAKLGNCRKLEKKYVKSPWRKFEIMKNLKETQNTLKGEEKREVSKRFKKSWKNSRKSMKTLKHECSIQEGGKASHSRLVYSPNDCALASLLQQTIKANNLIVIMSVYPYFIAH